LDWNRTGGDPARRHSLIQLKSTGENKSIKWLFGRRKFGFGPWKVSVECSSKNLIHLFLVGSCPKRQKPQAPTPQAPIRNRQTRNVANAKGLNRNTDLTQPNLI